MVSVCPRGGNVYFVYSLNGIPHKTLKLTAYHTYPIIYVPCAATDIQVDIIPIGGHLILFLLLLKLSEFTV
jgi:hypothetical protein